MTLPEVMVTAALVATFFASIFELNGLCLRFINASKDNVSAIEGVQDRLESLRSLAFSDLSTASYITTLLTTPANSSNLASIATETVTLTDYAAGSPIVTYTRPPGAISSPSASWSGGSSFPATTTLIKATVQYTWSTSMGGRTRTEKTETIISDGTKK